MEGFPRGSGYQKPLCLIPGHPHPLPSFSSVFFFLPFFPFQPPPLSRSSPSPSPTQGSLSPALALVRDPRPQFLTPFSIRLRFRVCDLHARLSFPVPGVPFSFLLPSLRDSGFLSLVFSPPFPESGLPSPCLPLCSRLGPPSLQASTVLVLPLFLPFLPLSRPPLTTFSSLGCPFLPRPSDPVPHSTPNLWSTPQAFNPRNDPLSSALSLSYGGEPFGFPSAPPLLRDSPLPTSHPPR